MFQTRRFNACLAALFLIGAAAAQASTLTQDFSSDPMLQSWSVYGEADLFCWTSSSAQLAVTWDSSKTNSYFAVPLGNVLTEVDTFSAAFDLTLTDFEVTNSFQVAVGFLKLRDAIDPGFHRASGYESPNVVEFAFFPDDGVFGPSLTAVIIDKTGYHWNVGGYLPETLTAAETYRISMTYNGGSRRLQISLTKDGAPFATIPDATVTPSFAGFEVDAFSVNSYSGAGQDPAWAGSILAHGTVDNVSVTYTQKPLGNITGGFNGLSWQATFRSLTNYTYSLERTADFTSWTVVDTAPGSGSSLALQDPHPPVSKGFYRVEAQPGQ